MTPGKTTTLAVRTPEGVVFSLPLAGPVSRFVGWAFDAVVVFFLLFASVMIIGALVPALGGVATFLMLIMVLLIPVLYGMVLERLWQGQTIGKKLARLRVIDETGLRLSWRQIVLRNLLRPVDSLPPVILVINDSLVAFGVVYLVGGICCALTRQCQRLGDIAAGTVVIRLIDEEVPDAEGLLGGKFNSFRSHPHLEARLRQRVSPEEAQVALGALMRREKIEAGHRVALFRDLADHFRSEVDFPESVTHGLTDEQYVRNVVDSVFRSRRPSGENGGERSRAKAGGAVERVGAVASSGGKGD